MSSPQTLVPPSAPRLPADIALTGAASPTGSIERAWVASIQLTNPRSTSSMTYLRARASALASSMPTPTTAAGRTRADTAHWVFMDITAMEVEGTAAATAAVCSRFAVKSATASCWAASRTECGCTTAACTRCSSTRPLWTRPVPEGWVWRGWCRASPSRCLTMSAPAGWRSTAWSQRATRGPGTPTVFASVSLKDGAPATPDSSSLPVRAGWRCYSTTTDSTQTLTDSPDPVSLL